MPKSSCAAEVVHDITSVSTCWTACAAAPLFRPFLSRQAEGRLGVWYRNLMVHHSIGNGRMRYGPGSPRGQPVEHAYARIAPYLVDPRSTFQLELIFFARGSMLIDPIT